MNNVCNNVVLTMSAVCLLGIHPHHHLPLNTSMLTLSPSGLHRNNGGGGNQMDAKRGAGILAKRLVNGWGCLQKGAPTNKGIALHGTRVCVIITTVTSDGYHS